MFKMSGVCIVVLGFKTFNRMTYIYGMHEEETIGMVYTGSSQTGGCPFLE